MPVPPNASQKSSRQTFLALQNIEFRWLLASNAAFFLSLHGQMLTRSYLAWNMTGEEMSLAYINAAYAIPMILCSIIGGALTDRFERRGLIQIGQAILLVSELAILLLLVIGQLAFWHLIVAGIIGGIVIPLIMPARTAMIFNIVGAARLGNAMALSMAVVNITRVIGPALMGLAISQYSVTAAYIIANILFLAAYFFMLKVDKKPIDRVLQGNAHLNLLEDIVAGLRYVSATKPVLACLVFGFLPMCLAMPIQNLLILYADNVWGVGEAGLGILMAVSGLGGVLGSLWLAMRGENSQRAKLMVANALGFTLCLAIFSLTSNFYLALAPLLLANLCASAAQTLNNTTVQLLVDDQQRGRVSALMMMAFGFTPLGVVPLAWAAQHIGIAATTTAASALLAMIIGAFFLLSATLRTLDTAVLAALKNH